MKKLFSRMKRIIALLIVFGMVAGLVPAPILGGIASAAEPDDHLELNNGYIQVTVSEKNGGFGIRTVKGDKVNKSDNDKYLVYAYDGDNTSFTSFQVTRNGVTKEYIFGGKYPGSSGVTVSGSDSEITASWSVDDLTIRQTITLANSGSTEHGAVLLTYTVENSGEAADVKCRILMDTAMGYQDYAYYQVGKDTHESEIALGENGYEKSFYALNDPDDPTITAYTINASVDNRECKPYKTIFAHWNNLASTVFDYTPDPDMTFTNFQNVQYLTSDSAYAQYFDLGRVEKDQRASAATNYGVYSNESMDEQDTVSVNVNAPDVLQFADAEQTAYENGGQFQVKTHIKNIAPETYSDICIVVTTAGCISALDQEGNPPQGIGDGNYSMRITDVTPGEQLDIDWNFVAEPQEVGQYSRIHYKVYDVSDEATGNTGALMLENLLGEGYSYILCPGSVEQLPRLKFTGASPDTIFTSGIRSFHVTGENFSMLLDKSAYTMKISRVDGMKVNGQESFQIPGDQFSVDDSVNVISIVLNDEHPGKLPEGQYQITLDYLDPGMEDLSGSALRFHVSDDERYKNETYGFLAVVRDDQNNYSIEKFYREDIYWDWLQGSGTERENVLLEFQGIFAAQHTEDGSEVYLGVSNNKSHNVMTMNGSLDIRSGSCTITQKNGSVTVDFDADLYTTGSNTFVYSGVAALTELEAGTEYGLIPYSENGERGGMSGEPIALLWPSVGEDFQNLMGLLFNLRYGELGVIAHEGAPGIQGSQTRLVAFGAALDLSFLIPESVDKQIILDRGGKTRDALGSSWDAAEHNSIRFSPEEIRTLNNKVNYREMTANTNATMEDVQAGRFSDMTVDDTPGYNTAYVVIDDILFGGEYLGLNMEVALGIPPYIMNMPALECVLSVHTVGDWSFGVDGECHFGSFKLEASLGMLSHDGIPIVDSMSLFLGGFTPGFNIDGVGVLWLQGARGGIENIYDTIFLTEKIPPLKLLIGAQFSIMQIFNAYASMGLSLQGVELNLTNGQFLEYTDPETEKVTIPQPITLDGSVRLDWYPEFYFHAAVNLAIAMAIRGSGYIVADQSGFYEFFIRGSVSVPSNIPIIGGYEVAGMGMGVNTTKLWGKINYLSIVDIGVTYYWGGDIDWSGSEATPTYPELLGDNAGAALATIPVDYDAATGRTLYMAMGTNVRASADHSINDLISSDVVNGRNHTMKLERNGSGKILSIQWTAEDLASAREAAQKVTIANNANPSQRIPIVLWQKDAAENANANLSFDESTKTAYLSVAFGAADPDVFGKTWDITTMDGAQLVVYDVLPMPTVTVDEVQLSGNAIHAQLGGYRKEAFTRLTIVAEGKNSGEVYLLGGAQDPFASGAASLDLNLPEHAVSDTYDLRIICTDDDAQYYQEATAQFAYTNPNQPKAPTGVSAENAGDYMVAVSAAAEGAYDGFRFTVRDAQGSIVSGMSGILMNKDGSLVQYDEQGMLRPASGESAASFLIGGRFQQTVLNAEGQEERITTGLNAGDYTIEVRTWKKTANGSGILVSEPAETAVTVREPVKTQILVQANAVNGMASVKQTMQGSANDPYQMTIFADSSLNIRLSSDAEAFTGTWRINGGFREDLRGEITEATNQFTMQVKDLAEGQHSLTFRGTNQHGDSVSASYIFAVDTLGPRLMLDAPVNGGLFDYWTGALSITGLTDQGAMLTVVDKTTGEIIVENEPLNVEENGRFRATAVLERTILNHDLTIRLTDALGNGAEQEVSVMSNGLGSIEKLMIYCGDTDVTNTKLTAGGNYSLSLMAKLKTPANAQNAEELIVKLQPSAMTAWNLQVLEGDARLEDTADGILLSGSVDAECLVSAGLLVSDAASWSVCAAYGYTGEQILPLDEIQLQITAADQYYTGNPVTTQVQVWYRGVQLQEGVDYILGDYANNVEPTTAESKATVQIHGMGAYTGTVTGEFAISYLEPDAGWVTVSGTQGSNGYYISDVSLMAAEGYELVDENGSTQIVISAEGEQTVTFRIRRLSDGAMTDLLTQTIKIDKTAPSGSITMDQTTWSKFVEAITFGAVKVDSLAVTVEAQDNLDVDSVEYVISETAYSSVSELIAAELNWSTYQELFKPTIEENRNQVIYVRITDKAGNTAYLSSEGLYVDTVAPVVRVDITETTSSAVTFRITASEPGSYYYVLLPADAFAPSAQEVKAGTAGVVTTAGEPIELTIDGLKQNMPYVIYAVAEDQVFMLSDGSAAPNLSDVAASGTFATDRLSLNDGDIQVEIQVEDALYTGEAVKPAVTVKLNGVELTEGVDYEATYFENVEVSEDQPYVQINGMGDYVGVLTAHFAIRYLPLDESWITLSGIEGQNGYYVSDVSLVCADGYAFVVDGEAAPIQWNADGDHVAIFRIRRLSDGAMTDLVSRCVAIDKTAPAGSVTVENNTWMELLNTITFGLFFNKTQQAEIAAEDTVSGMASVEYVISQQALTESELKMHEWNAYTEPVGLDADGQYVVYAKLTDRAGNITYLSSDGMVIDTVAPVVSGIEDGGTYVGEVIFTVVEDYIDYVSINGVPVTGVQHKLKPMDDVQTIVVRDKAGNETVLNVLVTGCAGGEDCPSLGFVDLDPDAWYHLSVDYVLRNGLMQGYGNRIFAPGDRLSRAMVVQVLYNLENRPEVSGESAYTDVSADMWYTDAIIWATQNGIINGYGNGQYGPDDPVTREQMAAIFYRYSSFRGYSLTEGSYDHFADHEAVDGYAEQAMRWAVGKGLLMGREDGTLCPGCHTNRAEFATVIQRFCETIAK